MCVCMCLIDVCGGLVCVLDLGLCVCVLDLGGV